MYPSIDKITKIKKYSGEWFRSTDPWVMSPVRFHCATPLSHVVPSSRELKKRNNGLTAAL